MTHRILIITALAAAVLIGVSWVMLQTQNSPTAQLVPVEATPASSASASTTTQTSSPSSPAQTQTYTLAQIAAHNNASSCWTAINGKVYDVTSWINEHPGGPEHILGICGTDGSAAFNDQHAGQGQPAQELATFYIGDLSQ